MKNGAWQSFVLSLGLPFPFSANTERLLRDAFQSMAGMFALPAGMKVKNASRTTHITVFDGTRTTEKIISQANIRVEGQTSGEWVPLGSYRLSAGHKPYVQISNQEADGIIVADAVLFVPSQTVKPFYPKAK